jgi:transketolase
LAHSVLTDAAENVYGIISPKNPFGRGIRYGIAEANMGLVGSALTQDILPGGYRPVSLFGTFAVFTNMMVNSIRLTVIGNQQRPEAAGFFIALASHDGPDIAMDGPTHQGLYWMSIYDALPGIKVYKPFDANEVIEMLFYALEKGEPIVLAVPRNEMPVLDRKNIPDAREAGEGAYVYKDYSGKGARKICMPISGPQILQNVLTILPDLEKRFDVKVVNVTSPELFEDLRRRDAPKAEKIFSAGDRNVAIAIHNGWKGWLNRFLLPVDYDECNIGVETYLKSGTVAEVYELAGLDAKNILKKILLDK